MTYKNYMVIELPKSGGQVIKEPSVFDHYDAAFDYFNQIVAEKTEQQFSQPKGEQPLCAAFEYEDVELWIITRTTDLIKNKN